MLWRKYWIGPSKCNPDFVDSGNTNCQDHIDLDYCTSSGGYGQGWDKNWGTFDNYATNGQTALVCPQCGCSDGKLIW